MTDHNERSIVLWVTLGAMLLCGCAHAPISSSNLAPLTSFDTRIIGEPLPVRVALYLPPDFLQEMPLQSDDPNLWSWFFQEGVKPVFEAVTTVPDMEEATSAADVELVIQPELWGFYFQSYRSRWTCWLDFRFRFLDRSREQITLISADGREQQKNKNRTLASCMNQVIARFQEDVLGVERSRIVAGVPGLAPVEEPVPARAEEPAPRPANIPLPARQPSPAVSIRPKSYAKEGFYIGVAAEFSRLEGDFDGQNFLSSPDLVVVVPNVAGAYGLGVVVGGRGRYVGFEVAYLRSTHDVRFLDLAGDATNHVVNLDLRLYPVNAPVQPYFLLGFGLRRFDVKDASFDAALSIGDASFSGVAGNLGAGLVIYMHPRLAISGGPVYRLVRYTQVKGVTDEWIDLDENLSASAFTFGSTLTFTF